MEKMLFVHGWFLQEGMRINLNPDNGLPLAYEGAGLYTFHGVFCPMTDSSFIGHVDDVCGHAEIRNGRFENGVLTFEKLYTRRTDVINYRFAQDGASPVFTGSYDGTAVGKGSARIYIIDPPENFFVQ
ncbi:MAG: hypothetical protein V4481_04100 [Patescibacteria group bacterium]